VRGRRYRPAAHRTKIKRRCERGNSRGRHSL
jgi:hypothetical protein